MKAPKKENHVRKIERSLKYFNFSILLFFVFGSHHLKAQVGLQASKIFSIAPETVASTEADNFASEFLLLENVNFPSTFHPLQEFFQPPESVLNVNSKAYALHHDGFFCRLEVHMEKKVKVPFPVKFRLGEFKYEERLEGKEPLNPLSNGN